MAQTIRYITHPQVLIDPTVEVGKWSLSPLGLSRINRFALSGALHGTKSVFSSAEVKALETAKPLAKSLQCPIVVNEEMNENDRSSTGFLPPDEFEKTADLFFGHPMKSVRGWETATHAQQRIVGSFEACLEQAAEGDILCVGHGAVGTLLYCHLAGLPISRAYDQSLPGGGSYFEIKGEGNSQKPRSCWRPIEGLF